MLRADSSIKRSTFGIIFSTICNLLLDIILINVFNLGIFGAGIAISVGQMSAILIYITHFRKKNINLKLTRIHFNIRSTLEMMRNGFAISSSYLYQALYILIFNKILLSTSGANSVAIYNTIFNVSCLSYAVFDGLALAMPPLIGVFLGEKSTDSVISVMKQALKTAIICGSSILISIICMNKYLFSIFGIASLSQLGAIALNFYAASVVFTCINSVLISYLQTIGFNNTAITINFIRNFLCMILLGSILVYKYSITGVGITFFVSEIISLIIIILYAIYKKQKLKFSTIFLLPKEDTINTFEVILSSNFDNLYEIVEKVEIFCNNHNVDSERIYYINLAIEEFVSDIARNEVMNNKNKYIAIKISQIDDDIYLRFRDNITNYNPFEQKQGIIYDEIFADFDMQINIDEMGMNLIKQKAKSFKHQQLLVFNHFIIVI